MCCRFAKWKREAEEWYAHDSVVLERFYEDVCSRVVRTFSSLQSLFTDILEIGKR